MKAQFRRELDRSFARVPIDFGKPKYVPLDKLITGVVIKIVTEDPIIPIETDAPRGWVVQPESDVYYVPGGAYILRLRDWGRIDFLTREEKKKSVRTVFAALSVLSSFVANYDSRYVTYRLQTGIIQSIVIDDYYSLTAEEARVNSPPELGDQLRGDHLRQYKAMAKSRGKRNTARGKYKRQKYSYQPLIRR